MKELLEKLVRLQELELAGKQVSESRDTEARQLREQIPPTILGHYDRLMARGKKGVAVVRNGVCSECHMRVAIGIMAVLVRNEDIQLCGTCGRYLFLPPATPAVESPAPSRAGAAKPRRRKAKQTAHA